MATAFLNSVWLCPGLSPWKQAGLCQSETFPNKLCEPLRLRNTTSQADGQTGEFIGGRSGADFCLGFVQRGDGKRVLMPQDPRGLQRGRRTVLVSGGSISLSPTVSWIRSASPGGRRAPGVTAVEVGGTRVGARSSSTHRAGVTRGSCPW